MAMPRDISAESERARECFMVLAVAGHSLPYTRKQISLGPYIHPVLARGSQIRYYKPHMALVLHFIYIVIFVQYNWDTLPAVCSCLLCVLFNLEDGGSALSRNVSLPGCTPSYHKLSSCLLYAVSLPHAADLAADDTSVPFLE
jgi:hypothetical protein